MPTPDTHRMQLSSQSQSCPPSSPTSFPIVDLSWLCLYVGALVCWIAITLCRNTYKLSEGFRRRVAKTGFATVDADADRAVKARVMLAVFRDCWPSTVSELIEDTGEGAVNAVSATHLREGRRRRAHSRLRVDPRFLAVRLAEAAHGMVFRSLMVMGCLCSLCCDFASLSPAPSRDVGDTLACLVGCVHVMRKLMMAAAVGFCFAPATGRDHGVAKLRSVKDREEVVSARLGGGIKIKELCRPRRLQFGRTAVVGSVHVLLALTMLSALPFLELVALGYDVWATFPELRIALEGGSACASVWLGLTGLRLFHVVAINVGLMLFTFHFSLGFFTATGGHSYKGFWAEVRREVNSCALGHANIEKGLMGMKLMALGDSESALSEADVQALPFRLLSPCQSQ